MPLCEKSRLILEHIAKGHSYEQILVQELAWTYSDIFQAAAEALELISCQPSPAPVPGGRPQSLTNYDERMQAIRQEYPRAYEKWTDEEDGRLRAEHQTGKSVKELAAIFERQPGAIRSRLQKFGLIGPAS